MIKDGDHEINMLKMWTVATDVTCNTALCLMIYLSKKSRS